MPFPPQIDDQIKQRFQALIQEVKPLLPDSRVTIVGGGDVTFYSLRIKVISLIQFVLGNSQRGTEMASEIGQLEPGSGAAEIMLGTLRGLKDDYELGMLNYLYEKIEADIAADYLGQAEQLLQEGQRGKFDHVPAAVLTGATLEDALRRLCQRQTLPVSITKPNGDPKMMNSLIDDLKKANVFNKLKAQQLRAWAGIRNAAAHGEFQEFDRKEVEQMLLGVQNFLADYL